MPNFEDPNFKQEPDGAKPSNHLSNLKVDPSGSIHEAGENADNGPSQHYIDKYGELGEIIDNAALSSRLSAFDGYLNRLSYAIAGGKNSADLHLIEENELERNILALVKLFHNVIKESNSIMTKMPNELSSKDKSRAGELLRYIQNIKERRLATVKQLALLENFSDEEVWRQTHIPKEQFTKIILTDLNIDDNAMRFTERKLFDISQRRRRD